MLIQLLLRYITNRGRISRQLPIDSETSVADLQQLIFTNFGIPEREQIIRFIQSNYEVRVIPGFSLEFYEIRNNSIIEIQRIDSKKDQEKKQDLNLDLIDQNYKNDIYEQRMQIINRLRNQTQYQNLSMIKEEEEELEETEDDKVFKQAKEKFFVITRENKIKNQEIFFSIFENLSSESQFNLLNALDNVGWSGIHYAILFNNELLIKKILELYGNEMLNVVSRDGWSPLFFCLQQKNWNLFRQMLPYATKQQCEIQTQKGSLLHQAFKEAPFDIIKDMILNQKVNPQKKDFEGIVALDIVRENIKEKIKYLYKITEIPEKPYSIYGIVEKNSIFFNWMKRYLRLNIENRVLERYRKKIHIPFKPCEVMPLKNILNFRIEDDNDHLQSKQVFIKFDYNKEQHVYRASYKDGQIWQILMEKAFQWVNYYNKFPGNKANTQYVDKIKILWDEIDKDYEEFELDNSISMEELLKKDIFPQEEKQKIVKLDDFYVIQLLGRGAFARVYKVVHKYTKKIFAMKVLKKENLIKYQQEKYSKIEKEILKENQNNPFLLSLHFAFQDVLSLFMIVDYCPNGDLSILLARQPNNRFSEFQVKIYIAQIVLALEDLHRRNYIYRDLKPENILIDKKGYLKLADFGLAANDIKTQSDFAKSFCGSPIYLSPELLKNKKTYKVSDFYTLGVVMYELLTGEPPFYTDDLNRLYNNIKKGYLQFPNDIQLSLSSKDLIQKLMRNNPKTRLGANNGTEDIKLHKFFIDIDWNALKNKEIPPPIQFQQIKEVMPKKVLQIKQQEYQNDQERQYFFKDFDYIREEYIKKDNKQQFQQHFYIFNYSNHSRQFSQSNISITQIFLTYTLDILLSILYFIFIFISSIILFQSQLDQL